MVQKIYFDCIAANLFTHGLIKLRLGISWQIIYVARVPINLLRGIFQRRIIECRMLILGACRLISIFYTMLLDGFRFKL